MTRLTYFYIYNRNYLNSPNAFGSQFLTVTADNASAILLAFKETSFVSTQPNSVINETNIGGISTTTGNIIVTTPPIVNAVENEELLDIDELPDIDDAAVEQDLVTNDEINLAIDNVILDWSALSTTDERRSRNSCLAHLLQLAIKDSLAQKEITTIIKKVNAIVTWFHKSNKYYTALRELRD